MKRTFYTVHVDDADGGEVAVPTLKAAKKIRSDCEGGDGRIMKYQTGDMPLRELLCHIYNRAGFAASQIEICDDLPFEEENRE